MSDRRNLLLLALAAAILYFGMNAADEIAVVFTQACPRDDLGRATCASIDEPLGLLRLIVLAAMVAVPAVVHFVTKTPTPPK